MNLFLSICVGILILILVLWTIELFRSIQQAALRKAVDDVLDSNCVEHMICELEHVGEGQFTREEIWQRMATIWKEIQVFALASSPLGSLLLLLCGVLYLLVWLKTLLWPHGGDLRILLGAELFMLCQLKRG